MSADLDVELLARALPPAPYLDRDGRSLTLDEWLARVSDADYRTHAATHLLGAYTGGVRITIRTEWLGVDLRPDPTLGDRPLVWRTTVTGGALDGRCWLSHGRERADHMHGHAIGWACRHLPSGDL